MVGDRGVWISNIHVVNNKVLLVDGLYLKNFVCGSDTLPSVQNNVSRSFVTKFENGVPTRSMSCNGKIIRHDQNSYCVVGNDGQALKQQTISKYNLEHDLVWRYSLLLDDSIHATLQVSDVCFDNVGNTYALFSIEGKGRIGIKDEFVTGPADIIIKIGKSGESISFKKISPINHTFNKLTIKNDKICASGGLKIRHTFVFNYDLAEIQDDEFSELSKFGVWDGYNSLRIVEEGFRPLRMYYLEKYNSRRKVTERKEVFRDTVRFQEEIYQYNILAFDKKKILCVYVSRGERTGNDYGKRINILVIKKRRLAVIDHITIDCDKLITGSSGIQSDIAFSVFDGHLLIGNEYKESCRIGDLYFRVNDADKPYSSFFILRQSLD